MTESADIEMEDWVQTGCACPACAAARGEAVDGALVDSQTATAGGYAIDTTSAERVAAYDAAPTMKEQGIDAEFVNWRGFFAAPGLPADKLAAYQTAIAKMYETPEWEAVRARNGWVNIHNSGDDFKTFLEGQEKVIGDLMKELGFL